MAEARRYMGLEILAACRKTATRSESAEAEVTIEPISAVLGKVTRWPSHTPPPGRDPAACLWVGK